MPEYYAQRANTPGTLLISEGVFIAARAGGYANVPGIWSDDQIAEWKKVTDAVHTKGSFIYLQLWALGRAANPDLLAKENLPDAFISSSPIALSTSKHPTAPRELPIAEIQEYVQLYATAAENAITAGFDGVELHGANGYLIDQFLQDVSNKRTDAYGGSVANRVRFAKEAVDAVVKKIGAQRTGIRVSPWGSFQGMRMDNPIPTFAHLAKTLLAAHPNLAYIHVVEPRVDGASIRMGEIPANESNDFIRDIVRENGKGTKVISAGGYTRESGIEVADGKGDLIAYGRPFLANPDLPLRLKKAIPLNESNRKTYYLYGNFTPLGYTDYPFAEEAASRL
jgi:NADPH2 dehydrogenase